MERPAYYSIIPATVRYDSNLTANAKLLYGEITALANKEGYCWASNAYFSNLYSISHDTVRRYLKQLSEGGYVRVEVIRGDSNEVVERRVYVLDDPSQQKRADPPRKNEGNPPRKNEGDNNTRVITTINEDIVEIVDHLNQKTGQSFRHTSKGTRRLISARLSEGYTVDDFKKVIDKKAKDWLGNEWERYLRPSTLFNATNFENYVNAPQTSKRLEYDDEGWL